jgi:hypothetical protein
MLLGGSEIGQMDESFCVVLVVHRVNTKLLPNFTLHCLLIMQFYQNQLQISTGVHSSHRYKNLTIVQPSTYNIITRPHIIWNVILQLRTQDSSHPIISHFSLSKCPKCLQPTFIRKTIGHFFFFFFSVKIYFLVIGALSNSACSF